MSMNETDMSASQRGVSYCDRDISRQISPDLIEIIAPPAILTVLLVFGLLTLSFTTKRRSNKVGRKIRRHRSQDADSQDDVKPDQVDQVAEMVGDPLQFFSDFDHEVLDRLTYDFNHVRDLVRICLPATIVIVVSTFTIYMRSSIYRCIWPHRERASMNTALTCFLAPAGLVFALSFGFVFALVLEKHAAVYETIANELSWLDQMLTMTTKFNWSCRQNAMAVIKAIKSELVLIGTLTMNKEPSDIKLNVPKTIKVHIWTILDVLHKEEEFGERRFNLNSILVDRMVDYLIHVNSICTDRIGALHADIHPLKWCFLEILASVTILGMLLVDASSDRAELVFCQLTTVSICMLFYLLADFDSPFNGFFRVTTAIIPEVVERSGTLYHQLLYELQVEQARRQMEDSLQDKKGGARTPGEGGEEADGGLTARGMHLRQTGQGNRVMSFPNAVWTDDRDLSSC